MMHDDQHLPIDVTLKQDEPAPPHPPVKERSKSSVKKILFSIIILAALAAAGYYLYTQLHHGKRRIYHNIAQVQLSLTEAQRALQQQQQLITQQQHSLEKLQSQVDTDQAALQKLAQATGRDDQQWVIAEVKYLLHLANMNLDLQQRPDIALKMLQESDQRLASLANPGLVNVRRVIANDIAALQAVPHVDLEALILQLDALNNQLEKLPLVSPQSALPTAPVTSDNNSQLHGWRLRLKESLSLLGRLVIIRRHDQPIEPLLSAQQQIYLIQNLHLMLEQAQWAAMRQQENVYQLSLQRAEEWIEKYFDQHDPKTQAVISSLKQLQTSDINPPTPAIADSLQALQQATTSDRTP